MQNISFKKSAGTKDAKPARSKNVIQFKLRSSYTPTKRRHTSLDKENQQNLALQKVDEPTLKVMAIKKDQKPTVGTRLWNVVTQVTTKEKGLFMKKQKNMVENEKLRNATVMNYLKDLYREEIFLQRESSKLKEKAKERNLDVTFFAKSWLSKRFIEENLRNQRNNLDNKDPAADRTFSNLDYKIVVSESFKRFSITYFKKIINNKPVEADMQLQIFIGKFLKLYKEFLYARHEYPKGIGTPMIGYLEQNPVSDFVLEPGTNVFLEFKRVERKLDLFMRLPDDYLLGNKDPASPPSPTRRTALVMKYATVPKFVDALCHLFLCSIKFEQLLMTYHERKSKQRVDIFKAQVKSCESMVEGGEDFCRATWYAGRSMPTRLASMQKTVHRLADELNVTSSAWTDALLKAKIAEFQNTYGDLDHVGGIKAKFKALNL